MKKIIKKHLDLALHSLKMIFMTQMEHPAPMIFMTIGNILSLGLQLIFWQAMYANVGEIGGWHQGQIIVLAGTWYIITTLGWMTFARVMFRLPRLLISGHFDRFIVRPVDFQMFSFYHWIFFTDIIGVLVGIYTVYYGATLLNININWWLYLLTVLISLILYYSLFIIALTINFYKITPNLRLLFFRSVRLGRYPEMIYKGFTKILLSFIFPVLFVFSVPVNALFGELQIKTLIIFLGLAIFFFVLSRFVWLQGQKNYTSAGG